MSTPSTYYPVPAVSLLFNEVSCSYYRGEPENKVGGVSTTAYYSGGAGTKINKAFKADNGNILANFGMDDDGGAIWYVLNLDNNTAYKVFGALELEKTDDKVDSEFYRLIDSSETGDTPSLLILNQLKSGFVYYDSNDQSHETASSGIASLKGLTDNELDRLQFKIDTNQFSFVAKQSVPNVRNAFKLPNGKSLVVVNPARGDEDLKVYIGDTIAELQQVDTKTIERYLDGGTDIIELDDAKLYIPSRFLETDSHPPRWITSEDVNDLSDANIRSLKSDLPPGVPIDILDLQDVIQQIKDAGRYDIAGYEPLPLPPVQKFLFEM